MRHSVAMAALAVSVACAAPACSAPMSLDWFGVSVEVPAKWQVLYRADEDQAVLETGSPENYIGGASASGFAYILVLRPGDDAVASIKFAGQSNGGHVGIGPMEVIWGTVRYMESASSNFEIVVAPESTSVGGVAGARARYRFTADADGEEYALLCDLWIVPFHGGFLQIAATVEQSRAEILFRDARDIVKSVELSPPDNR